MAALGDIVRRLYDEMWNCGNETLIADIFHPEFTFRGALGTVLIGHDQFQNFIQDVLRAMPDFYCEVLETTEQENRVIAKLRYTGTQHGEFFGFAPTGKQVCWLGSAHFTFQCGLVTDLWAVSDVHGLIHQLAANQNCRPRMVN